MKLEIVHRSEAFLNVTVEERNGQTQQITGANIVNVPSSKQMQMLEHKVCYPTCPAPTDSASKPIWCPSRQAQSGDGCSGGQETNAMQAREVEVYDDRHEVLGVSSEAGSTCRITW